MAFSTPLMVRCDPDLIHGTSNRALHSPEMMIKNHDE
jgi:hypothetical protein